MTPMKAIRLKCLDCAFTANEVRLCPCMNCPLWLFRFGHRPKWPVKLESHEGYTNTPETADERKP